MTSAVPHWDRAHEEGQTRIPGPDDPVLVTALEHFGGDVANSRLLQHFAVMFHTVW